MAEVKRIEYLFLGGGKGGKSLAMEMARQGKRVAVIERGMIGGSCINVACIPSKALIHRARAMHAWRDAAQREDVTADMAGVSAYVASVVNGMVDVNRRAFEQSGLELVIGTGRFVAARPPGGGGAGRGGNGGGGGGGGRDTGEGGGGT
ncbi:FAD-dependent oxidoreductase, partial [Burkholderia cenocepacia]|uniref:FAD-dependent oxidoreductase n=1 Tax=Burkholderia cenocepacia TaxID=95486 RepID=UPI001F30C5F3